MNVPTYLSGTVFMKSYRILRGQVVQALAKYGLTPTSWSLLGIVVSSPDGIRLKEVASRLGVKAPLVTMITHSLIERALVERMPHHLDKRAKLLVITTKGRRFIKTVEQDLGGELAFLLRGLSAEDMATYKRVLDTIIRNGSEAS